MRITTGIEYDCKLEVCKESNIVTLTKYEKKISTDLAKNFGSRCSETTEKQYQENKKKNIRKSAKKIMTLVKHNVGQYKKANGEKYPPVFLTLTFAENVIDWEYANNEYMKFIKRLNYKVYGEKCSKLAYIGVPELQDRGAIHYHILFFNLPYIDKAEVMSLWGLGTTRIEKEDNRGNKFSELEGESLAKYITKYMTKQFYDKDKKGEYKFYYDKATWEGKKIYFASKNLFKPVSFKLTQCELNAVEFVLQDVSFTSKLNTYMLEDEECLFSVEEEYRLSDEKIKFLLCVLPTMNGKYIKTKFSCVGGNSKSKRGRSVLDVGVKYGGDPYDNIDFSFGSFAPVVGEF